MSIRKLTQTVKKDVKCYGLWRKTSTAKTKETVSTYIMSYLDETSKAEALAESRKLGYAAVHNGVSAPQQVGIDYLTKEEKGKIRAYGFLRDDVARFGGMPSHLMDNGARVIACHRAWMGRLESHPGVKKFAHKYGFGLDPCFCALMAEVGKDCDALLVQGVRHVMRRFQEKHYPGDRLGYLVGVDHDRKRPRARVLLFPFTENGQNLRVSDTGDDKRFHELRKTADKFIRDYFFREFESPVHASERPVDKVMQARILSLTAWQSIPKNVPEADRLAWAVNEKRRLQGLPEEELRTLLTKRHEDALKVFAKTQVLAKDKPGEIDALSQAYGRQQVELKLRLQQVDGSIKEAKERQRALTAQLQAAQKELGSFRFTSSQVPIPGRPVIEARTQSQRNWLQELLSGGSPGSGPYPILQELATKPEMKAYLSEAKASGHLTRDLLRKALRFQLDELRKETEKVKAEIDAAYLRRQGLLIGLESVKVIDTIAAGVRRGRMPLFLEQFQGLKKIGASLPILCRPIAAHMHVGHREAEQPLTSFEELNPKIMNTLRAFQGEQAGKGALEIDRYFQSISESTSPAHKLQQREEEEKALRKQIESPSVQEFLMAQNLKQQEANQAEAAASLADSTVRLLNKDPEFDL